MNGNSYVNVSGTRYLLSFGANMLWLTVGVGVGVGETVVVVKIVLVAAAWMVTVEGWGMPRKSLQ